MTHNEPQTAIELDDDRPNLKNLVRALLAIIVILGLVLAFLGGYFLGKRQSSAPASASQSAPANSGNSGNSGDSGAAPANAAPANDQFAPTIEHAQTADLLRTLPRREANDPRALGPVDAPIVVTVFGDYSCPMCTKFEHETMPSIKQLAQKGEVRIEWRNFAIFAGQYSSDLAANGGWAAANQGKFWEFHDHVYAVSNGHPTYTREMVVKLAQEAGVPDMAKFEKDLDDPQTAQKVKDETAYASTQLGLSGTPTVFVGQAAIIGAYPTDYFLNTISNQVKEATK